MQAITVAMLANSNTDIRARNNSWVSVNFSLANGFNKFSEKIAAGARIAELVVLMMADNRDPKKKNLYGQRSMCKYHIGQRQLIIARKLCRV